VGSQRLTASAMARPLLNLSQCIDYNDSSNGRDLIFLNLSDLCTTFAYAGLVNPYNYHPSLIISIHLPFVTCIQNYVYTKRKFSTGDYALFYNILSHYDWS
jgi:hypothetical protein